jgi:hypothetical protein
MLLGTLDREKERKRERERERERHTTVESSVKAYFFASYCFGSRISSENDERNDPAG